MKTTFVLSAAVAGLLFLSIASEPLTAQDRVCSNASLKGAYGFVTGATLVPAGTPRGVIGRWYFDGSGHFTSALTINDNGTILKINDSGTYALAPDCTGRILPGVGGGVIEIVLVDGGNEFYQLRTAPGGIVLMFSAAKKQFPGIDQQH